MLQAPLNVHAHERLFDLPLPARAHRRERNDLVPIACAGREPAERAEHVVADARPHV